MKNKDGLIKVLVLAQGTFLSFLGGQLNTASQFHLESDMQRL